jgi:hypothetical protein
MKRRILRVASRFASIEVELRKVDKTKLPIIFLGGRCVDNEWREKIKSEFEKSFCLLDPFDKKWQSDKIYDELAALVKSDYVVFYQGGENSKKEKKFLDRTHLTGYKEFDKLETLREFLRKLQNV